MAMYGRDSLIYTNIQLVLVIGILNNKGGFFHLRNIYEKIYISIHLYALILILHKSKRNENFIILTLSRSTQQTHLVVETL